jgi:hypothetical protein
MVLHELWRVRSMLNLTTTIVSYNNYVWAHLNEYLDNKIAQRDVIFVCTLECGNRNVLTVLIEAPVYHRTIVQRSFDDTRGATDLNNMHTTGTFCLGLRTLFSKTLQAART